MSNTFRETNDRDVNRRALSWSRTSEASRDEVIKTGVKFWILNTWKRHRCGQPERRLTVNYLCNSTSATRLTISTTRKSPQHMLKVPDLTLGAGNRNLSARVKQDQIWILWVCKTVQKCYLSLPMDTHYARDRVLLEWPGCKDSNGTCCTQEAYSWLQTSAPEPKLLRHLLYMVWKF